MTYEAAIKRLNLFSNYERISLTLKPAFSIDGELELLRRIGDPHMKYPCVHVAGTVGKGSVCIMLEAALREAGFKTGLYTSPHISDIRERITVRGKMISKKDFAAVFETLINIGGADFLRHTFFEVLTAMGFLHFAREGVDIAIIETGLGGRLDSTNVLSPLVSVITRIGLDHKAVLGGKIAEIASDKAGIIKPGAAVVALKQPRAAATVIESNAKAAGAPLLWAEKKKIVRSYVQFSGDSFYIENLSLAKKALDVLASSGFPVSDQQIERALKTAVFPCRMQRFEKSNGRGPISIILDAAHNPSAALALRFALESSVTSKNKKSILVAGMMKDKDANGFFREIAPIVKTAICVGIEMPRAYESADLAVIAKQRIESVRATNDISAALDTAMKIARRGDTIIVTGSFYIMHPALQWLKRR